MKLCFRVVLLVVLLMSPGFLWGQELRELENELRHTSTKDTSKVRRVTSAVLNIDPHHERATWYLIELLAGSYAGHYRGYTGNEAIEDYFRRLIELNPMQPKAYYLKAMYMNGQQYRFGVGGRDSFARAILSMALRVDSLFIPANLELGTRYYGDFIRGHFAQKSGFRYDDEQQTGERTRQQRAADEAKILAEFPGSAVASLKCLERVWQLDTTQRAQLQQALLQLSKYFDDSVRIAYYEANAERIATGADGIPMDSPRKYFTIRQLMDTLQPLAGNPTLGIDYLAAANMAGHRQQWYSKPLSLYQEPVLGAIRAESYRFVWIPSFRPAVTIRLERRGDRGLLTVKRGIRRDTGSGWMMQIVTRRKTVSRTEMRLFLDMLDEYKFQALPMHNNVSGLDGACWILESQVGDRYHLVHRWSTGGEIEPICRFLIRLSGRRLRTVRFT